MFKSEHTYIEWINTSDMCLRGPVVLWIWLTKMTLVFILGMIIYNSVFCRLFLSWKHYIENGQNIKILMINVMLYLFINIFIGNILILCLSYFPNSLQLYVWLFKSEKNTCYWKIASIYLCLNLLDEGNTENESNKITFLFG